MMAKVKITDRQLQALNDLVQRDALGGSMLEFDEITDVKERLDKASQRRYPLEQFGVFFKEFGLASYLSSVSMAVVVWALSRVWR